jgi:diphthamide synthase (EF-2-diphthine--ammonia ligase)
LFPLWGASTTDLALEMIDAGLRARIVSVNLNLLPREFAGREFDRDLLRDLPLHVDACGENGEFHTFAYSGPMFGAPVPANVEGFREHGGFVYAELNGCPVSSR